MLSKVLFIMMSAMIYVSLANDDHGHNPYAGAPHYHPNQYQHGRYWIEDQHDDNMAHLNIYMALFMALFASAVIGSKVGVMASIVGLVFYWFVGDVRGGQHDRQRALGQVHMRYGYEGGHYHVPAIPQPPIHVPFNGFPHHQGEWRQYGWYEPTPAQPWQPSVNEIPAELVPDQYPDSDDFGRQAESSWEEVRPASSPSPSLNDVQDGRPSSADRSFNPSSSVNPVLNKSASKKQRRTKSSSKKELKKKKAVPVAEPVPTVGPIPTVEPVIDAERVRIPVELPEAFSRMAQLNTVNNVETCAYLLGYQSDREYIVTDLYIPPQTGTADECDVLPGGYEAIVNYADTHELLILGWIHTHPSQACIPSWKDLATQCFQQRFNNLFVGIIVAPSDGSKIRFFSLTKEALDMECFEENYSMRDGLYTITDKPDHVSLERNRMLRISDERHLNPIQ